jgi:hypothetical protein
MAGAIALATPHAKPKGPGGGPKPPSSPRPPLGGGWTVLDVVEPVLRHRHAIARGKAVPFPLRAYGGGDRGLGALPDRFCRAGEWGEAGGVGSGSIGCRWAFDFEKKLNGWIRRATLMQMTTGTGYVGCAPFGAKRNHLERTASSSLSQMCCGTWLEHLA